MEIASSRQRGSGICFWAMGKVGISHLAQCYLGMLWLGELLYPDYTEYDLQERVTEYYKLFYGCDLTDEMYQNALSEPAQYPQPPEKLQAAVYIFCIEIIFTFPVNFGEFCS